MPPKPRFFDTGMKRVRRKGGGVEKEKISQVLVQYKDFTARS